jgi:hypothetical protein
MDCAILRRQAALRQRQFEEDHEQAQTAPGVRRGGHEGGVGVARRELPSGLRAEGARLIDEVAKRGSRTRLLKIEPGAYSTEPFVHDHWEEVFLVQGDLVVGNDAKGKGGQSSRAFTYACRPPGVRHGPFTSKSGCLLYEIHYYETSGKRG